MTTTLNDLKQKKESGLVNNPENLRTLTPEEIKRVFPEKKEENTGLELLTQEFNDLDMELTRRQEEHMQKIEEEQTKAEEVLDDVIFDAPIEDFDTKSADDINALVTEVYKNATDPSVQAALDAVTNVKIDAPATDDMDDLLSQLNDEDEDLDSDDSADIKEFDDESADTSEEDDKKMLKDMQKQIDDIIKPFDNIVDLKAFTISTKPKAISKVLKTFEEGPTATWVLLDSRVPFTCTPLGAVEIENLNPEKLNVENGRIDALKQMYGTLFKHYTSPNKPEYLESWLKTISYSDHDNLIFGYYKATFGTSNLITYVCDKCKEVKIENVPIENCIKYKDEETKKEVQHILKYGDPSHRGEIKAKLIQVSDRLAVSIKSPSIYNIVFEFGVLEPEFTRKFADVLGTVGYIEDIYEIDIVNKTLVPIKVKEEPGNITASVKRRIRSKVEVLKTLTPDQYQILTTEIAKVSMNAERISYRQPEYKCAKCDNVINENEMTAQEMLFIRHQLALVKTLSIE